MAAAVPPAAVPAGTAGATNFRAHFEGAAPSLPGAGLPWLARRRREGLARFESLGFPTTKQEAWRFTDAGSLAGTAFLPASPAAATVQDLHQLDFPGARVRMVFVNGRYSAVLSSPATADVSPLSAALAKDPGAVEPFLGRVVDPERTPFVGLNDALWTDGAFIRVPGPSETPVSVEVLFVSKPGSAPAASHPRVLIVAEPGARLSVVEGYVGDGAYFTNAVTEVRAAEGAEVSHVRVQRESAACFHAAVLQAVLARDARFTSVNASMGAAWARHDVVALLDGAGAFCRMDGLYLADGRRLVDNHTTIDHLRPGGTSRELYKGILAGRARGIFNGEVVVRPDAQKTDSIQTNKNLLLSDGALVHTKPELRIEADDVKCKHGATIGRLNPDMTFYLRSRGLGEAQARRLLAQAFAAEALAAVPNEMLREDLNRWAADWLPEA